MAATASPDARRIGKVTGTELQLCLAYSPSSAHVRVLGILGSGYEPVGNRFTQIGNIPRQLCLGRRYLKEVTWTVSAKPRAQAGPSARPISSRSWKRSWNARCIRENGAGTPRWKWKRRIHGLRQRERVRRSAPAPLGFEL